MSRAAHAPGVAFLIWLLAPVAACSDPAAPAEATPCEVATVLAARCVGCHSDPPAPGVPFSLATFADTRRTTTLTRDGHAAPAWQVIGEVLDDAKMPLDPATGTPAPMDARDPDRTRLLAWVDAGAPPGPACAP